MQQLKEALISATKFDQNGTAILLQDLLDRFSHLDYKITQVGDKNLITFNSEYIGEKGQTNRDQNPTIDGKIYNCNVLINKSHCNNYCYINFANTSINCFDKSNLYKLLFKNSMTQVQIHSELEVYIQSSCFIEKSTIKCTSLDVFGNETKTKILDGVNIESNSIRLNTWHPDCVSKTSCLCNTLIVINSEDTVFKPIDRFMRDIRNEQNDSEKNIVNKSKLQSWMHICTGFQFKKLPSEIRIIGNHLIYKYIQQKNGSYQYSIIQ